MNGNEPLARIVEEIEYMLARKRHREQERPYLEIMHSHHQPGTVCVPGETIDYCHLRFPQQQIPVPLSLPGLMLCDCMVRHHHIPLSIARLKRILTNEPFYRRLGTNSFERIEEMPTFTSASLRVYITRLREQITKALRKGGSMVSPEDALVSEPTDSNVLVHRVNLPVAVIHRTMKRV
jgi:hypothetical protein